MSESFPEEPILPQVEEADLAQILYEDITDPLHIKRWAHFVETYPALASIVLERSYIAARDLPTSVEATKKIIDTVTFVISALEAAVRRNKSASPSADGDDATQPPSA